MPACRHYLGLYPEGRKSCAQGRDIRGWAIRISGTDFDIVNRVPCVNDVENPLFSCPGLDRKTDEEREAEAQAFRAHANKIIAGLPRIKKLKQMMIERRLYRAKANCPWCTSKDTLRIICNINGNRHISVSCTECGEGFME